MVNVQVVILAGGKGTRLGFLAMDTPKPLVRIAAKPILTHQLEVVRRYGATRILILTGHLGERIADHYGDGAAMGLRIDCIREETPMGTAGALKAAEALLEEQFLVIYGDVIFDMDLRRLARFHLQRQASATLVVHPNDHPQDSDLVEVDDTDRIRAFHRKDRPADGVFRNLVNAGVYCLARSVLDHVASNTFLDFGLDVFPALVRHGVPLAAYRTPEYLKDVGTLARHALVERDILSGKVARHNLERSRPAVFMDRDGVLNTEVGDACSQENLELLPRSAQAVALLNNSDHLAVVVTNQPGIAKGFLSEADVDQTHAALETTLGKAGAYLDRIYVCPHHPSRGFAGERPQLKIACTCRKPEAGLFDRAAVELNVDLATSYMIGDRTVDVEAGRRAGVATILVQSGFGGRDGVCPVSADFQCRDLAEAIELILASQWLLSSAIELAGALCTLPSGRPIVAIGGLSRTGKTTLATLLTWQLSRRGKSVHRLCLDEFMLPPDQRALLPSVRQRFDYHAISQAVATLPSDKDIVIIEGVVALDISEIRQRAAHKLFISGAEARRRERFLATYVDRGESLEQAIARYDDRDQEERQVIAASAVFADRILFDPHA